jgi:hypothetical protein
MADLHRLSRTAQWEMLLLFGKPVWGGVEWLDDLVKQGSAIDLGGNGYPTWYTAKAKHLLPFISANPPLARDTWRYEPNDVLLPAWHGKTKIDSSAIALCRDDEWLVVEAWDES